MSRTPTRRRTKIRTRKASNSPLFSEDVSPILKKHPGASAAFSTNKLNPGFGDTGSAAPRLDLTNNGVSPAALVGDRSGDYTAANNEYHRTSNGSPFAVSNGDVYFSLWVYFNDLTDLDYTPLLSTRDPGASGYEFTKNGTELFFGYSSSSNPDNGIGSGLSIAAGNFYFVECWTDLDNLEVNFRLNNGSIVTKSLNYVPSDPTWGLGILARKGLSGTFTDKAKIDNPTVEVGPRGELVLPSKSTELYNSGRGRSISYIKDNFDLSHVQILAGYENQNDGDDLINDYPDNSAITSLTANSDDGQGPKVSGGKVGNAGVFEAGNSDSLKRSTDEDFQVESAFTAEVWVKINDTGTEDYIVGDYDGTNGWELNYNGAGNFRVYIKDSSASTTTLDSTTSPLANTWYHAVVSWSGSDVYLYVDGSQEVTAVLSSHNTSTNDWSIGNPSNNARSPLDGSVSLCRFWNGRDVSSSASTLYNSGNGLSLQDIESDHPNLLDDLVAAYEFEDTQDLGKDSWFLSGPVLRGRRASDDVERNIGFGLDGETLDEDGLVKFSNGGNVFVPKWYDQSSTDVDVEQSTLSNQPRIVNGGTVESVGGRTALHFDPSQNQYLIASSHPFATTELTVMAWVYRESTSNVHAAITKGNLDNNTRNVWLGGDNGAEEITFIIQDSGGTPHRVDTTGTNLPSNTWTLITGRYDGSAMDIFQDGSLVLSSNNSFTPVTNSSSPLTIGAGKGGGSSYFDGYIDTPLLFPRALSDQDIRDIYEFTK